MTRVFLLAGEASGDLHGALLCRALKERRPDLEVWGVGGARMEAAGAKLLLRSEELAVVGVVEVLGHAPKLLRAYRKIRRFLREERPDCFIPIDYPDFNFRLLPHAARAGIPIVYYISPQVWAWRAGRIHTLRRFVRRMVVIFPFEQDLYRRAGVPVTWVGHPLTDLIAPAGDPKEERARLGISLDGAVDGPVIALLPGSRRSEVERIGPLLRATRARVDAKRRRAGSSPVRWLLGLAAGLPADAARSIDPESDGDSRPGSGKSLQVLSGVDALRAADFGLVASGTVTLEAALLGRPVVVVYKVNALTYALARRLVRVEHIAMANLIAGRRLVPEYLQDKATPEVLSAEVERLLEEPGRLATIRAGLLQARESLGPPGAAGRAAEAVCAVLEAEPQLRQGQLK